MQADGVAMMVDGVEVFDIEDVGEGIYVAAQRSAREGDGIIEAFALSGVDRIIDGVVGDARG